MINCILAIESGYISNNILGKNLYIFFEAYKCEIHDLHADYEYLISDFT